MSLREPNLADLLGPTFARAPTLPVVVNPDGKLILVLLTDRPLDEVADAIELQEALGRGVLVRC